MGLWVTLIIFALLMLGIFKKVDIRVLLLGLSFLTLCILTAMRGSVLGDATTGSAFLDIFAYIVNYFSSNLGATALPVILVFAYVEVLTRIHATDMMAYLISIPIRKVKSVYLSVAIVVLIGSFLRIPTGSGPALIALMLALFYPMLRSLGCPNATAAAAMIVWSNAVLGPADPSCVIASQVMGIKVNYALWFTETQLPFMLFSLPILIILFVVLAAILDKKEPEEVAASAVEALKRPDCPVFFAILPLLPLFFMIVFSPLMIASVSMNVGTACILSMAITLLSIIATSREKGVVQENLKLFFSSLGNNITSIGMMMMFGMLFATCMSQLGGLNMIADGIRSAHLPDMITLLLLCAFTAILGLVLSSFYGTLSIGLSLAASFTGLAGLSESVLCYLVLTSVFAGTCCAPAGVGPNMIAAKTGVPTTTIIKRIAAPIWITLIISVIISGLLWG